jgi:hypothetical protein
LHRIDNFLGLCVLYREKRMISSTGSTSSKAASFNEIAIDVPTPGTITPSENSAHPIDPTVQALKLERYLNAGEMLPGTVPPPIWNTEINSPAPQEPRPTKFQRAMAWCAAISFSAAMPALLLPMFVGPIGFILPGILLVAAVFCAVNMKLSASHQ